MKMFTLGKSGHDRPISGQAMPRYKVVLMGDSNSGKTSLVSRYITGTFYDSHFPTIGESLYARDFRDGQLEFTMQIIDTAGVEDYGGIAKITIRDAAAVVFVCSFDNADSLDNIEGIWWKIVTETIEEGTFAPFFVATKNDIPEDEQEVDFARLGEIAVRHGSVAFTASAKSGDGVNGIFQAIADRFFTEMKEGQKLAIADHPDAVEVDGSGTENSRQSCC